MSLINFGAGLAAAGKSMATFAGMAGLESLRAGLEEDRARLASEWASERESRGRKEAHGLDMEKLEAQQAADRPHKEASTNLANTQADSVRANMDINKDKERRAKEGGDAMAGVISGGSGVAPGNSYEKAITAVESRGGKMIPNELGSGAYGPYQFMPSTWSDVRSKNPELNLPEDMKQATPEQHKAAFSRFTAKNAEALQRAGVEPTAANLYLAHRFGAAGAEKVAKADENTPLGSVMPPEWQQQNPDMRGQTVGSFKRLADERMKGVTLDSGAPTGGNAGKGVLDQMPQDYRRMLEVAAKQGDAGEVLKLVDAWVARQQKASEKVDSWLPLNEETGKKMLGSGYDPNKSYQINRTTGEIKPIGGAMVNVDQRGEGTALKVQIETANKAHSELQEGAKTARTGLAQVNRLTDLMNQINTGKFTSTALEVKRVAQSFGIDLGEKEIGVAEAADALTKQLALQMRNPAGGAGMPGAMSDADREYLQRTIPSLNTTSEGRAQMVQMARAMFNRTIEEAKIANQYLRSKEFAADPSGLYAKLQEFADANPLFPQAPGSAGGAQALSGQAATRRATPSVGEVMDGYRFKGGNPADRNSWEKTQ